MAEQTWRNYFVAPNKTWKSRIGSHSQSSLMRLYKKEKNIRSPPKGTTGEPRGVPGTYLNNEIYEFCTTYFSLETEELYLASVVVSTDPQAPHETPSVPLDDILGLKKRPELNKLAQQLNLKGTSTLKKAELVVAILRKRDVSDKIEPVIEAATPPVASLNSIFSSQNEMLMSPDTSNGESESEGESGDHIVNRSNQSSVILPAITRNSKQGLREWMKYLKQKADEEANKALLKLAKHPLTGTSLKDAASSLAKSMASEFNKNEDLANQLTMTAKYLLNLVTQLRLL